MGSASDADAHAPDATAQEHDDNDARPLSLPQLNLLASLHARQDVENDEAASRPSSATFATTDHTLSVPMLDESSALRRNLPQRNDEDSDKQQRLSFSPSASVWGQMGRAWTTDGRNAPRTTETKDYVAFFHQFFGLTNNPALAVFTNVLCRCQRYFM